MCGGLHYKLYLHGIKHGFHRVNASWCNMTTVLGQGRSLAQIRRGAVPHQQVPVPGVNSGINVVDPGPSVPIQSKCVCKVSLYIEMKLCIYQIFRKLILYLQ